MEVDRNLRWRFEDSKDWSKPKVEIWRLNVGPVKAGASNLEFHMWTAQNQRFLNPSPYTPKPEILNPAPKTYTYEYIFSCICVYVYMYIYIYIYIYVCVCVCACVYTYIYIYIHIYLA